MPRFIAVHTLPFTEEQVIGRFKQLTQGVPSGAFWTQTWCDFTEHKFFCEWVAESKEVLEQGFKRSEVPFEAIYQVRRFDVPTGQLEP